MAKKESPFFTTERVIILLIFSYLIASLWMDVLVLPLMAYVLIKDLIHVTMPILQYIVYGGSVALIWILYIYYNFFVNPLSRIKFFIVNIICNLIVVLGGALSFGQPSHPEGSKEPVVHLDLYSVLHQPDSLVVPIIIGVFVISLASKYYFSRKKF